MSIFEKFLKELGQDFAYLGRQVPIKIDLQTYSIDMVLNHRGIPCWNTGSCTTCATTEKGITYTGRLEFFTWSTRGNTNSLH